jgi:hypothetical protein
MWGPRVVRVLGIKIQGANFCHVVELAPPQEPDFASG